MQRVSKEKPQKMAILIEIEKLLHFSLLQV